MKRLLLSLLIATAMVSAAPAQDVHSLDTLLRWRFMITAENDAASNENVLFSALSEQVGRPVNEYIAGDVDEWLAAMNWALEWDAANDNNITSKTEHADALESVRSGLESLIANVEDNRETIPKEREANGLENR
jgi:hypothetical protein